MNEISQIVIGIFGVGSCYLTATKRANYACIFGIIAQPAWFYTTIVNKQWGIFFLSLVYTFMWSLGIYNYWIKKT